MWIIVKEFDEVAQREKRAIEHEGTPARLLQLFIAIKSSTLKLASSWCQAFFRGAIG